MKYTNDLAREIGKNISALWGTYEIEMDEAMKGGSMVNIKTPFTDNIQF